jgi:hypothetical protein
MFPNRQTSCYFNNLISKKPSTKQVGLKKIPKPLTLKDKKKRGKKKKKKKKKKKDK